MQRTKIIKIGQIISKAGWKINILLLINIMLFSSFSGLLYSQLLNKRTYQLSDMSLSLLKVPDQKLFNLYEFDQYGRTYTYNKEILPKEELEEPLRELVASAGNKEDQTKKNLSVKLSENFKDGKVIYENTLRQQIRIVPLYEAKKGAVDDRGYFIYPINDEARVVYTPLYDGLKEDIILDRKTDDVVRFDYMLELGDFLEARKDSDGSIGIYSADPEYFGVKDIKDNRDWEQIKKIRMEARKNNLLFSLPRPVIVENENKDSKVLTYFELSEDGRNLTLVAEGLHKANYPVAIDPTITVTSSSDFLTGSDDGSISYSTANEIGRSTLNGAVPTFSGTGMGTLTTNTYKGGIAAYNGFMYSVGGTSTGTDYLNTVAKGTVGSDGLVTSWSTSSQGQLVLSASNYNVRDHSVIINNGYIYVVGGNKDGTVQSSIIYAQIDSSGNVTGDWNSTTALPAARRAHSAVAYDGYLYVLGGDSGTAGTSAQSTVYSAPFNANGTIGTWKTDLSSMPAARFDGGAVAFNNALYYVGGDSGSGTSTATTYYVYLNGDGSFKGSWLQESSDTNNTINLPTARRQFGLVVNNGYIYALGGTGTTTKIEYATTNTDGTISNWYGVENQTAEITLSSGRSQAMFLSYKGIIYAFGGNVAGALNTGEKATIASPGTTSQFKAGAGSLYCVNHQAASATYNGYVYLIAGQGATNCGGSGNRSDRTTKYAKISTDGTLGTWSISSNLLPYQITLGCSLAYQGYLYFIGGWSPSQSSTFREDVYSTPINESTGNISSWTAQTSLPKDLRNPQCFSFNNRIYVLAGTTCTGAGNQCATSANTSQSNSIYYATPSNGSITSWTTNANNLPSTLDGQDHPAVVYAGKIYVLDDDGLNIQYNDISLTDGTIDSSWTSDAGDELVVKREQAAYGVWNGYIYFAGGSNTAVSDTTYYVKINSDGTLQQVGETGNGYGGDIYATVRYPSMIISRGTIVVMGGCNNVDACTALSSVEYALANNGGGGGLNTINNTSNSLSTTLINHCSVALNNYLYTIGGNDGTSDLTSTSYVKIDNNGDTNGAWSSTTSLPESRIKHECITYNGYIYVIGGSKSSASKTEIYYASQNSDGTLGSWTSSTNKLSTARESFAAVTYGGKIYALGGYTTTTSNQITSVEVSTLGSDGAPGSWSSATSLSSKRQGHAAVAYGGFIIVMGGYSGTALMDNVEIGQITSGTLGSWSNRGQLPTPTDSFKAFGANGYLYVIGGRISTAGSGFNNVQFSNEIYSTPLLKMTSDLYIGEWDTSTVLSTSYYINQYGIAYNNGFVYISGGKGGATGVNPSDQSVIKYAGIQSISRKGNYYKYIEATGSIDYSIKTIQYTGSVVSGSSVHSTVRTACNANGQFTSTRTSLANMVSGSSYNVNRTGHYILITFNIDDSNSAFFEDSNISTITQIDVVYEIALPPVNDRLMGGKYFKDQVEQPLDTYEALPGGGIACS